MSYDITFVRSAKRELERLQRADIQLVLDKIEKLQVDPKGVGCIKLKGISEELWRIRAGNYRIIYDIQDEVKIVEIRKIGHRRDVYR